MAVGSPFSFADKVRRPASARPLVAGLERRISTTSGRLSPVRSAPEAELTATPRVAVFFCSPAPNVAYPMVARTSICQRSAESVAATPGPDSTGACAEDPELPAHETAEARAAPHQKRSRMR